MALKGLDIFKLSPKKNCKECGSPTCMAFSMKVAQGAVSLDACPYFSEEAKAAMSEATAPPMKTIKVGTGDTEMTLGGETVLFRHEKTFVSKTRYAVDLCSSMDDALIVGEESFCASNSTVLLIPARALPESASGKLAPVAYKTLEGSSERLFSVNLPISKLVS